MQITAPINSESQPTVKPFEKEEITCNQARQQIQLPTETIGTRLLENVTGVPQL